MAFEEGVQELTCPVCGALHKARWARLPVREPATVECCACGGVMYRGKSLRDYYDVQRAAQ